MGKDSTMDITRADAMAELLRHLPDASDDELSQALYAVVGDRHCRNFNIVADYSGDWYIKYESGCFRKKDEEEE